MKLSVELFQKTVEHLTGDCSSEKRTEKRGVPRVGLRSRIHLHPIQHKSLGPPIDAWTRDISRVGLGIICAKKMKVGEHYLLGLPHEDSDAAEKSLALYCTVKCCKEMSDGIYAIGFSFEDLRTKKVAPALTKPSKASTSVSMPDSLQPADQDRIRKAILG